MKLSSWFRRSSQKSNKPEHSQSQSQSQQQDEELLGVTDQLLDFIKSFSLDTFKNFPFQEDEEGTYDVEAATASSGNVRNDLSEWQERHALIVLSKSKIQVVSWRMKEHRFWRIYFMLVKSYVTEYELQAIRLAKLRNMAVETEKTSDTSAYEVEMADRNEPATTYPPTP